MQGGSDGVRRTCSADQRDLVKRWLMTFRDLEAMFQALDVDHNGFVDFLELTQAVAPYGPEWQPLPDALMAMGDVDGDGKINLHEFLRLGPSFRRHKDTQER